MAQTMPKQQASSSKYQQPIKELADLYVAKRLRMDKKDFWSLVIWQDVSTNSTKTFISGSIAFNQGSVAAN
jgi:hypothetical protein